MFKATCIERYPSKASFAEAVCAVFQIPYLTNVRPAMSAYFCPVAKYNRFIQQDHKYYLFVSAEFIIGHRDDCPSTCRRCGPYP